jgi:hypothetical protein
MDPSAEYKLVREKGPDVSMFSLKLSAGMKRIIKKHNADDASIEFSSRGTELPVDYYIAIIKILSRRRICSFR